MHTALLEPAVRPTIVVLLDDTGQRVYEHLLRLTPSLDPTLLSMLAILRYCGNHEARCERLRVVLPDDEETPRATASDQKTDDGTILGRDTFARLMVDAVCDVQDVRALERMKRAGVKVPHTLAQVVLVGRADSPALDVALGDVRQGLALAKHSLGAMTDLDAPVFCALADYGVSSREFTEHVRVTGPARWDGTRGGPSGQSEAASWPGANGHALSQDDAGGGMSSVRTVARVLDRETDPGVASHPRIPPATFQFLYSRIRPDHATTFAPELTDYVMAEALFALAATGQALAPTMGEVSRALPGISASEDRVGSLGACLVRFPRSEAERFCLAALGADVLRHWAEHERVDPQDKARVAQRQATTDEARGAAARFAEETLLPWIRGDLLADFPVPGEEGWPDEEALGEQTRRAGQQLARVFDRMDAALSDEEIARRLAESDPAGEARRDPERFGRLWDEVTWQAWQDYLDIERANWPVAVGLAYRGVGADLTQFLARRIDSTWLDPHLGWEVAGEYADAMATALYDVVLESLADDRVAARRADETTVRQAEGRVLRERRLLDPDLLSTGTADWAEVGKMPATGTPAVGLPAVGLPATGIPAGAAPSPRDEREERALAGLAKIVTNRLVARDMLAPGIALGLIAAPVLILLLLGQLTRRWPLSFGLLAVVTGIVALGLGAIVGTFWLRARRRTEAAMANHLALMRACAARRRRGLEEQYRVFVVNQALASMREARAFLRAWPERIERIAADYRREAQSTSDELFAGPAGYHDILVFNGKRLLPGPDAPMDATAQSSNSAPEQSPLWPIYARFSQTRARQPAEPWHASLDAIVEALREEVRAQTRPGDVVRTREERFRALVRRFLRASFREYVRNETGQVSESLDLQRNPTATGLWAEALEHALPPHGQPGGDLVYIAGQRQAVDSVASVEGDRRLQRMLTHASARHEEWLLATTFRRGGILL